MEIFIARQPIFDRYKKIYGYEILYRGDMENFFPDDINGYQATNTILAHSLFNIGLNDITGSKKALINFTENHILNNAPLQLNHEHCIIEILENVLPSAEIIDACRAFKSRGYELALDDFEFDDQLEPLVAMADIIKIDFRAMTFAKIEQTMIRLHCHPGIRFLAEKVETYDEFMGALDMGFSYFQGFFFSKPEILKKKTIGPSKILLFNLLAEVNRQEMNFRQLDDMISSDVALSYKILRYINSAYYSLVNEVRSIRHALTLLGESGIRQFVNLAAIGEIAGDKPSELVRQSMIRAKWCELLSRHVLLEADPSQLFLLGLFSLLDAMLDVEMPYLVSKLPLSVELKEALTDHIGDLAPFLMAIVAYEQGDVSSCQQHLDRMGIESELMLDSYVKSLQWVECFE